MNAPAELRLFNRQRLHPFDCRALKRILIHLLAGPLGVAHYEIGIHIVRALPMSRLNARFLGHQGPTDVITFDHATDTPPTRPPSGARPQNATAAPPSITLHGEIYLCIDVAILQAREFGTTWPDELMRYAIHGLLHLLGHDDLQSRERARMKRRENALVEIARGHADACALGALPQASTGRSQKAKLVTGKRPRRTAAQRLARRR